MESQGDITLLLEKASSGDDDASRQVWEAVYDHLKQIAHRELRNEREGHTLSTTALVNEAYLKLVNRNQADWNSRQHFYANACHAMRRILVDYARRRDAGKRRAMRDAVPLENGRTAVESTDPDLLALDEALGWLEQRHDRLARVVEFRFFGGFTIKETAELLDTSTRTVERDFERARTYLYRFIQGG